MSDPGWACAQVVHRFFRCLDDNRVDDAARSFCEDGVWFRRGEAVRGRAAILAALGRRPAARVTRHAISNVIADEHAGGVTLRYDVFIYSYEGPPMTTPPLAAPHTLLGCEDELVRTADGWLFASRSSRVIFASR